MYAETIPTISLPLKRFRPLREKAPAGAWFRPFTKKRSHAQLAHVVGFEIDAEAATYDELDIRVFYFVEQVE
jgi:hypothetical protein